MNTNGNENLIDEQNKIYILGDRLVGKSSLICKLKGNYFENLILDESLPKEENLNNNLNIKGSPLESHYINLGIKTIPFKIENYTITFKELNDDPDWKFTKIMASEIEELKAVLVVFSLVSKSSFEYAQLLVDFLLKESSSIQIFLIGNKCEFTEHSDDNYIEVMNSRVQIGQDQSVTKKEIENYVSKMAKLVYFQISCYNNTNIKELKQNLLFNLDLDKNIEEDKVKMKSDRSCVIY